MISHLKFSQVREFLNFNNEVFRNRRDVKRRFLWHFFGNPFLEDKLNPHIFICYKENKGIIGQFLLNPFEWHFRGKTKRGYWGVDYVVLEDYRGFSGAMLAAKAIRDSDSYFTIGPSPTALDISLALGTRILGTLKKFLWVRNPISISLIAINLAIDNSQSLFHAKTKDNPFPSVLMINGFEFRLINELKIFEESHWNNTIESSRPLKFLKWRFFNDYKKYYFYMAESKNSTYFVVRKCYWRGLRLLVIVDYRVIQGDNSSWKSILQASKILAKETNCDGVITMSSHRFFDKELKSSFFLECGKEGRLISNIDIDVSDDAIKNRSIVYSTMADCDGDLNFGD